MDKAYVGPSIVEAADFLARFQSRLLDYLDSD